MVGRRKHSESKLKLFRAITTRISQHNQSSSVEKEDDKDTGYNASHAYISHNQNQAGFHSQQNLHHPPIPMSPNLHNQQLTSNQMLNNPQHPDTTANIYQHLKSATPHSSSVTNIDDHKNRYSHLDNFEKNHIKKTPNQEQNLNVSVNNERPIVLANALNTSNKKDWRSPNVETMASNESVSSSKMDLIMDNNSSDEIDEYDYKTFSTKHPLRLSKVKAFEQAEMTTKMFFAQKTNEMETQQTQNVRNDDNQSVDIADIIVQIPGMSYSETRNMLGVKTAELIITENTDIKDKRNPHLRAESNLRNIDNMSQKAAERLLYMKNSLKQLSRKEATMHRLQNSKLSNVFQNSREFLRDLNSDELDDWEHMNMEFETNMEELQAEYRKLENKASSLASHDIANRAQRSIERYRRCGRHLPKLQGGIIGAVAQRVKEEFSKEDSFYLNVNC